jgi:hypothetical protein
MHLNDTGGKECKYNNNRGDKVAALRYGSSWRITMMMCMAMGVARMVMLMSVWGTQGIPPVVSFANIGLDEFQCG